MTNLFVSGWTIIVDDYYSRDVSGKEIGVYSSYTLQYWNVWSGNEITGRINYDNNSRYYYLVESIMRKITIFKNKQYGNYPSNYEFSLPKK